jgi:hypothetical protein
LVYYRFMKWIGRLRNAVPCNIGRGGIRVSG